MTRRKKIECDHCLEEVDFSDTKRVGQERICIYCIEEEENQQALRDDEMKHEYPEQWD